MPDIAMRAFLVVSLLVSLVLASTGSFTIVNGQIFTPGLAIVDSPQPYTPLGGDSLQVALDVSGNGKLQLPPYPAGSPTGFNNITIFLYSYTTGLNLTITNGTETDGGASLAPVMAMESGSTVKHVNWKWPDCFIGDGKPTGDSKRGEYNISIHQNFILNDKPFYTIFDLPIEVTNSIPETFTRPSCLSLNNELVPYSELFDAMTAIQPFEYPFTSGFEVQTSKSGSDGRTSEAGDVEVPQVATTAAPTDLIGSGERLLALGGFSWVAISLSVLLML